MNTTTKLKNDIQASKDTRGFPIDMVGVKDIIYPIKILKKHVPIDLNNCIDALAKIGMYVRLPANQRGTHMSRFTEILNSHHNFVSMINLDRILLDITNKLSAEVAFMDVQFDYLVEKLAPISKIKSIMNYTCKYIGSYRQDKGYDKILEVNIPILTLCPCSKEISEFGAHNQRALVKAQVRYANDIVWIEDLITLIESCGSAPIYSLLKRVDEKFITEHSYKNPCFVEDVVRQTAVLLSKTEGILWFDVTVESFESIHNHSAIARIEGAVQNNR